MQLSLSLQYNSFKQANLKRTDVILLQLELAHQTGTGLKPNSKNYNMLVKALQEKCSLTPFQFYAIVGLLLSDASLSLNASKKAGRIKLQQTIRHNVFIEHLINELLPEWCLLTTAKIVCISRCDMLSFQTMTLPVFASLFAFLYNKTNTKIVPGNIERYLHPITLAYWFCGDGGKADYKGHSKAIGLYTQGFDHESVKNLQEALINRYGWTVTLVADKGKNQWWIRIKDFDSFITKVGPYIHPSMLYKLPTARSNKSRYGKMSAIIYNQVCGSFFQLCKYNVNKALLGEALKKPVDFLKCPGLITCK